MDDVTSSPISAFFELGPEYESTSSSSRAVPRLVLVTYAVASAVALACAPLIIDFCA